MRTTASIVLCLLLTSLFLPMMPVSATLIDAGQTEQISEKVVAWEKMSDGKIMMVTGSGILSMNDFEAGVHSEDWSLDLNVSANSATIDSGENLVAIAHTSGVVVVQLVQQVITQYINTTDPVDAVDWIRMVTCGWVRMLENVVLMNGPVAFHPELHQVLTRVE